MWNIYTPWWDLNFSTREESLCSHTPGVACFPSITLWQAQCPTVISHYGRPNFQQSSITMEGRMSDNPQSTVCREEHPHYGRLYVQPSPVISLSGENRLLWKAECQTRVLWFNVGSPSLWKAEWSSVISLSGGTLTMEGWMSTRVF